MRKYNKRDMKPFARNLKRLREKHFVSAYEFAKKMGKSRTAIRQWENAINNDITLSTLETMAGTFDMGLGQFLIEVRLI